MFARMTFLQIKPEFIDEGIALFEKTVVPSAKKQRGYRGTCLLSNRDEGKGIVVTFWATRADALANENNRYYQEQLVKFLGFFSGPPIREEYDVEVHALGAVRKSQGAKSGRPIKSKKKKDEVIGRTVRDRNAGILIFGRNRGKSRSS